MLFRVARVAPALLSACTCVGPSSSDGSQDGGGMSSLLPGPLPGWEEQRDGITCTHPNVVANCKDGWCQIPAGCFVKGSPLEEWGHPAYIEEQRAALLTHAFIIKQH